MMSVKNRIIQLEEVIGYRFKTREAISVALSHPGVWKSNKKHAICFERLEFLGDRVLGLSLATFLYENFQNETEGDLAVRMSTLAGTDFLIQLAKQAKIIECFDVPKDFFISINKNSSSIADMMEAVLGAIYLDSDFNTVKDIVRNLWGDDIYKVVYKEKDSKTKLQEIAQSHYKELPVYRMIKQSGEAHDPVFEIEVTVAGHSAIGYGNSKKNAEHDAARKMLQQL